MMDFIGWVVGEILGKMISDNIKIRNEKVLTGLVMLIFLIIVGV